MSAQVIPSSKTIVSLDELSDLVGQVLGVSEPLTISQERIDVFARATADHQWIHTDPVRAATGPFGTTIAHGFLSLSLLAGLSAEAFEVTDASAIVNYGLDKVRFPAPVPVDSDVQLELKLNNLAQVAQGVQLEISMTLNIVGAPKPAVVATQLLRMSR